MGPVSTHRKAARAEPAERGPTLSPGGQRSPAHSAQRETLEEARDGQRRELSALAAHPNLRSFHAPEGRGIPLESPRLTGSAPLLRGKRQFGRSRVSILLASRLGGEGKPVTSPIQVVDASRGTPSSRRRPWPGQNALSLPQMPRPQHQAVPQDSRATTPDLPLHPHPPRRRRQGTRPTALWPLHAPFPDPAPALGGWERAPPAARAQARTPLEGQRTVCAAAGRPESAWGCWGRAAPGGRGHVTRQAPPPPPRRGGGGDGAILAFLSVITTDYYGPECGRRGGSSSRYDGEAGGFLQASLPFSWLQLLLLRRGCLRLVSARRCHLAWELRLRLHSQALGVAGAFEKDEIQESNARFLGPFFFFFFIESRF